ncbi:MAG TPA: NADH-quinone oxidoreductase subunit C [Deltaproteobacteria bacterium]|nr:NADH-quinone oxidoreductase subunit C [Deltaproteobacteria bacterium]
MASTELLTAVEEYCAKGYRLVQICCVKEPEALVLHYTFDKDYELVDLKISISPEAQVPSITAVYPCAFLYENEIHDLFGVAIQDINVDFKGLLYKVSVPRPFNPDAEASPASKRN